MNLVRRAATVTGRVQGVSFRYYAELQANRMGLVGWIRNANDGSVLLEVQGPEGDVTDFLRWLHSGSPAAVVSHVDVTDAELRPGEDGFRTVR